MKEFVGFVRVAWCFKIIDGDKVVIDNVVNGVVTHVGLKVTDLFEQ